MIHYVLLVNIIIFTICYPADLIAKIILFASRMVHWVHKIQTRPAFPTWSTGGGGGGAKPKVRPPGYPPKAKNPSDALGFVLRHPS